MPFATSQGTTFEFNGNEYQCTNIKVTTANSEGGGGGGGGGGGNSRMDVSTLDLAEGATRVFQDPPLVDPNSPLPDEDGNQTTITISFLGSSSPPAGTTGTLETAGISGSYKCTQSEIEYAVGEIVKGSATFVSSTAS